MSEYTESKSADEIGIEILCGQHSNMCCLNDPWASEVVAAPSGATVFDVFDTLMRRFGPRMEKLLRSVCAGCTINATPSGKPPLLDVSTATLDDIEFAIRTCAGPGQLLCLCPILDKALEWRKTGNAYKLLRLACMCMPQPPARPDALPPPPVDPKPAPPPPPPVPPAPTPPAGCGLPPQGVTGKAEIDALGETLFVDRTGIDKEGVV